MSPPNGERGSARQSATPSTSTTTPHQDVDHLESYRSAPTPRSARIARRLLVAAPAVAHRRIDTVVTLAGGRLVALLVLDAPAPRAVRRRRLKVARRRTQRHARRELANATGVVAA